MPQKAPTKTSSRMRIGLYEEAERELLAKLKQKEKELKTLLAELQVTRNLLEEATHDREEEQESITSAKENKASLEEEIQSLEEVTQNVTRELLDQKQTPYQAISQQELSMATSYNTRNDLYNLMYKTSWTPDDANRFFTITEAHRMANDYDFNPLVRENLNQTYTVIQQVVQKREEQIKATYQPTVTKPQDFNIESALAGVKLNSTSTTNSTDSIKTMYKPNEKTTYTPATPKILEILKKK
ncbi:hypothetical protein K9M74_01585 [Candidatus Woesearchaeota archaeon]|nr:hypothetical protein [Candidatus Woesearchaeota archaeon]